MSANLEITDHAVLRYIERVHKIDIEAIKKQMQKGLKKELLNSVGNNKLIIKTKECDFIIENGKLITVYA